ncbi:MAG: penicillin-binding protein, partial [Deltaproteobacteria bacterium]
MTAPASRKEKLAEAPKRAPRRGLLRRLVVLGLKLGVVSAVVGVTAFWLLTLYLDSQLPDVLSVADYRRTAPQMSRVYAADGSVIGVFRVERRTLVRLVDLPRYVPDALVSSEDEGFYEHEGLDYFGMVRAMWTNVRSGRFSQGASTLTQQLARSFYLSADKTLERKLLEVFLARKLDHHLDKEEILELYLNQVYFGDGRYGVEEAARHYFGKSAAALDAGEAAALVGLLPSPDRLNPFADLEACLARRARVLAAMARLGKL